MPPRVIFQAAPDLPQGASARAIAGSARTGPARLLRFLGAMAVALGLAAAPTVEVGPGDGGTLLAQDGDSSATLPPTGSVRVPGAPAAESAAAVLPAPAPFAVGEVLSYSVSYAFIDAGRMRMAVEGIEQVEGRPAYRLTFKAETNPAVSALYTLKEVLQSWMDIERLHSLRFVKQGVEKGREWEKRLRLDQARRVRVNEETGEEDPMPPDAQDDVSIFYYIRTLPFQEGRTFVLQNLMDPDDNPMRVTVLGAEPVKVPAGTFESWALRVEVHTDSGVFSQGSDLRLWLSRDARRIPVKVESKLAVGSFTAVLTAQQAGSASALAAGGAPR